MLLSSETMRGLLTLCALSMAELAIFFLRQRRLPLGTYLLWGLLAILLPWLGPFIVLWKKPGSKPKTLTPQ
jgi:hypothetical protein